MNRIILAAAISAALTSTCAAQSAKPSPLLGDIRQAAATILKDAQSAQIERVTSGIKPNGRGEPTEVACGFINAKNGFGAYTGSKPFVFLVAKKLLWISGGTDSTAMAIGYALKQFCPENLAAR